MKTIIDIRKARYTSFGYINQEGTIRSTMPSKPTVYGGEFATKEFALPYEIGFPNETLLERAKRLEILDRWYPILILWFGFRDKITIKGTRAVDLWKAYNAYIFSKQKKKGKK